jgi:hypothetical protein
MAGGASSRSQLSETVIDTNRRTSVSVEQILERAGSEITWEIFRGERSWIVWASHDGETKDDSFKFCAAWTALLPAVEDVFRQIQKSGPEWARVEQ